MYCRMRLKTKTDQERKGLMVKGWRMRKRIMKMKRRKQKRTQLVRTKEPIEGQRCEAGIDLDPLQCLPFSCPSGLFFPKGIIPAIHSKPSLENSDLMSGGLAAAQKLWRWSWAAYTVGMDRRYRGFTVFFKFIYFSSHLPDSVCSCRRAENVLLSHTVSCYSGVLIFRPSMSILCRQLDSL